MEIERIRTIKLAEQRARELLPNLERCDFTGCRLSLIKEVLRSVDMCAKDFPAVADFLLELCAENIAAERIAQACASERRAPWGMRGYSIILNRKDYNNAFRHYFACGGYAEGKGDPVTTHEFGHLVEYIFNTYKKHYGILIDPNSENWLLKVRLPELVDGKAISLQADDPKEVFADAFAAYYHMLNPPKGVIELHNQMVELCAD